MSRGYVRSSELANRVQALWESLMLDAKCLHSPLPLISLAKKLEKKGLLDEAIHTYLAVVERSPNEGRYVHDQLIPLYRQQGETRSLVDTVG